MILVIVRQQHIVDLAEPGLLRRCDNAVGIAAIIPGQPVSTSSDCPSGVTKSVDWPPSTSMK
jgi:hypothetical protein